MGGISVRGIYATALTRLLMDGGFKIARPSLKVASRLGLKPNLEAADILIVDKEDHQGVKITGEASEMDGVVEYLRKSLPDAVVREHHGLPLGDLSSGGRFRLTTGYLSFEVELPGASKLLLDDIRNLVKPTLIGHHQLKIVDSRRVEAAEALLDGSDEARRRISREVKGELVYGRLPPGSEVRFEHVKLDGRILDLRPGRIVQSGAGALKVERRGFKPGGFYDGVRVPRMEGDYALTEVREGAWFIKHSYYGREGELKCEYYNVSTPVELYPDRVRYVDLEVDVVREAGGRLRIIDVEELDLMVSEGYLSGELAAKARRTAEDIARRKADLEG
ncbi:MAG: DUF402 domain-containing protein [Candidatus Bathyarchaeia archaeon]|nr:DUF402 domain-containing protein [Candidatus Bathyarchaeota archaeon]